MQDELLNRKQLSQRWKMGLRTLDRLRELGALPWCNMGTGKKSIVRFKVVDIEAYEDQARRAGQTISQGDGE